MEILQSEIYQVSILHEVHVRYEGKLYSFKLRSIDGVVYGDCHTGIGTSDLTYFDLPQEIRQQHFEQIKKYIEDNVSVSTKYTVT